MTDQEMPVNDEKCDQLGESKKSLVPDYLDDPTSPNSNCDEKVLPSFVDLKRKTLQSLYGLDTNKDYKYNHALLMDKSPKGSVDEKIRSMVDLINAHPSFATLSSCSGRISLFDPNHKATTSTFTSTAKNKAYMEPSMEPSMETTEDSEENTNIINSLDTSTERNTTGKGYGAWLISSHATIKPYQLISALEEQAKSNSHHPLIFKHEPLLLHVAASNISRARQLLKLALDLGFRESGTVITPKRITVAIRSHSLALTVPIASKGRLRPNDEFIEELVKEANDRFDKNEEKLQRLEHAIRTNIFMSDNDDDDKGKSVLDSVDLTISPLPDLNLWGHTSFTIPINSVNGGEEIIAFGGYGAGPNGKKKSASRSNKFYSLCRSGGQWDDAWIEKKQQECDNTSTDEDEFFYGLRGKRSSLPAREGCASCILPLEALNPNGNDNQMPIAAIFGGRSSPARPSNDLHLISVKGEQIDVFSPADVRGESPPPRWGHTLTALSGKGGRLAVLIGGRDEKSIVSSAFILSVNQNGTESSSSSVANHLIWEKVPHPISRFYHSTIKLSLPESSSPSEDIIIAKGGMFSTALIPQQAKSNDEDDVSSSENEVILTISGRGCEIKTCLNEKQKHGNFGSSSCSLLAFNSFNNERYVFTSGGISCNPSEENNQTLAVVKYTESSGVSRITILESSIKHPCNQDHDVNFGSMVHHSCLELSSIDKSIAEIALVGGGAPAFAFGQSFAR